MCGLVGMVDGRRRAVDAALLARMNDALTHRGPDEAGVHCDGVVGLGHRRLSIIDLASGHQPLFNEDRSVAVVFNGEIYNYRELAADLAARGHTLATQSDTEVIVHAWEEWGAQCVQRFRGMFAIALWDRVRRRVFLARDRLGVKPLYYAQLADRSVIFGSELKALRLHPLLASDLDPYAVEDYLGYGYVPEPRTILRQARKLPPASVLEFSPGEELPAPRAYWDVRFDPQPVADEHAAGEELVARLREAVRIRLVSEVPLGAFLSGGVDSSAVVAMMAQLSEQPVNTCAIGFEEAAFDESAHARTVAERYRTAHYTRTVRGEDLSLVERLIDLYDEPFADSSALPTYRVCQLARERVAVALSGDGGDENLAGYRRYRWHLREQRVAARVPAALRRGVFGTLGRLYPKLDWAPRPLRAKATLQSIARDWLEGYFHAVCTIGDAQREALYSPTFRRELQGYRAIEVMRAHAARADTDDPLARVQYLDLKTYLPGDILTKVDRASMAHGLEVRVPLLDHPLVEWMARLPSGLKLRGGEGKYIFKRALEPHLPREILYRNKMGFAVPLAAWFRGPLRARIQGALHGAPLAASGVFEPRALARLYAEHQSGRRDHGAVLWSLLMLDTFLRREQGLAAPAAEEVA